MMNGSHASVLNRLADQPDGWRKQAACLGMSPSLFFPDRGYETEARAAKEVCAICPVCAECLNFAMVTKETDGVFGGTSPKDRRRLLRRGREGKRVA